MTPLRQLMEVIYPNGIVAYAPVFPDGRYYGQGDVEAGIAVAEVSYDCPLDRYHEWLSHTPTEKLEKIEAEFGRLIDILGVDLSRDVLEALGTSEVYTHFRRRWEDL